MMYNFKTLVAQYILNRGRMFLGKKLAGTKTQVTGALLRRNKDFVILAISLTLLFIGASFLFKSANEYVMWKYDDTEHLSIAYNLFHGRGLTVDFIDLEASTVEKNIPALKKYDQISNPLRGKGPLYFVLLGAWLKITDANYSNWYFWGSIFNFILVASSVVIFYIYSKRYFGWEIAAFSAPILALMPGLLWFSVRLRPDVLAFILIIASLYYGARKIDIQNLVTTGIFCGLAHLTHPLGILPGSAFLIYLLLKGKFRAIFIFVATWFVIMVPWMVRNYIVFSDATRGLGLPIPTNISMVLGLASPSAVNLDAIKISTADSLAVVPFTILKEMFNDLINIYGMQLFVIFISFAIVAYISFASLNRISSRKNIALILGWAFAYALLILRIAFYENSGLFAEIFVLFGVPIAGYLYIRLFSGHRDIFTTNGKSIYTILAIFGVISFSSYFIYGIKSGRVDVEPRLILYTLYIFIPLAIIGIKNLLEIIFGFFIDASQKKIVSLSLVFMLVLFSLVQASTGINSINKFQESRAENNDQKSIDSWIIKNTPLNAKIASDLPVVVLLRTGHEAVNFARAYIDNPTYERWIIKKFDIDYLVFYYPKNRQTVNLSATNLGDIELSMVYKIGQGSIYKINS
jgi:hypothetical protein